ncbi:MAG: hypothetical protein BroJett003_23590 [Planctomycetota bacterium]|nr:MAG: hypothetical protein BroJett003_23590 [Planctomycetota bacterium]
MTTLDADRKEYIRRVKRDFHHGLLGPRLNDSKTKFVRNPSGDPANARELGVKSKQLYYLIKDAKEPADATPEDALKMPLLEHLLGQGHVVLRAGSDREDYFCASEEAWRKAGVTPTDR